MKKPKRPRDPNQLAKSIVDLATGEKTEAKETDKPDSLASYATRLGRLGGLRGGLARAKKLSAKRRKEIARNAAKKRWSA